MCRKILLLLTASFRVSNHARMAGALVTTLNATDRLMLRSGRICEYNHSPPSRLGRVGGVVYGMDI